MHFLKPKSRDEIVVGDFVKRQMPRSRHDHFEGSWDDLADLVMENLDSGVEGVAPHVMLVTIPPEMQGQPVEGFWTSIVQLREHETLSAFAEARRKGEIPVLSVEAFGRKKKAYHVQVVLYHHSVLPHLDMGWEIVSVNCSPMIEPVPMNPVTMARNQLEEEGGTKAVYSSDEWARAVWFWFRHARVNLPEGVGAWCPECGERVSGACCKTCGAGNY